MKGAECPAGSKSLWSAHVLQQRLLSTSEIDADVCDTTIKQRQATADAVDYNLLALLYAGFRSEHGKKVCASSYLV